VSIRLDWQIESEDEVTQVQEDASIVAERARKARRFRRLVIAVAVLSFILGSISLRRLQRAAVQRRTDLEMMVSAETLALRMGDRGAFLSYQDSNLGWQDFQYEVFDEYQTLGNRLSVDGEVLEMTIDANLGRVVLRETLDGEPYRVTWFYEYSPDLGWQQVRPITHLLGRMLYLQTDQFEVYYREADEEYARVLADQMETWVIGFCQEVPCGEQPRLNVFIVTEPLHGASWRPSDNPALYVPSPATARVPENSPLDDQTLRSTLVEASAWRAATLVLGDAAAASPDGEWMRDELAAWLASEIDETQPGSEVMAALVDTYGREPVIAWIERIQGGEPVLPTLSLLSGDTLTGLPIPWESFFEHRLRAVFGVDNRQQAFQDSSADFVSEEMAPPTIFLSANVLWDSIQVESIHREGSAWWIESTIPQTGSPDINLYLITKFSVADGDWVLTPPELEDWRQPQSTCSEHICIHAFALDAPAAVAMLPALEAAYAQAVDDLSPALPERPIAVLVIPSVEVVEDLGASPDALQVLVLSPYAAGPVIGSAPQTYVQAASLDGMMRSWIDAAAQPLPDETPVVQAFVNWELARLQEEEARPAYPSTPSEASTISGAPASLALAEHHGEGPIMDSVAAWALLEAIEAVYGEEAMGPLLAALPQSPDMETWLATVGGSLDEIEPLWEERLTQALNDAP
jgi:hypothetical protein